MTLVLDLALGSLLWLAPLHFDALAAGTDQPRDTLTLAGRVMIDAAPAAGATVYLREAPVSWTSAEFGMRPASTRNLAQTTADALGNFEFKEVELPAATPMREYTFPLDVIAHLPGRGIAWRHIEAAPNEAIELSLPEERKVAGRVRLRAGEPAIGARVRVREIAGLTDPWRPSLNRRTYVDLESSDVPLSAVTEAAGRFVLRGLPANIRATLVVDDDRYLLHETYAATTHEPQPDLLDWPDPET